MLYTIALTIPRIYGELGSYQAMFNTIQIIKLPNLFTNWYVYIYAAIYTDDVMKVVSLNNVIVLSHCPTTR